MRTAPTTQWPCPGTPWTETTFSATTLRHQVKAGRLRALAVSTAQRSSLVPGLPAVAETVPGYESISIFGVWAPAKTPEGAINRLNGEIAKVLTGADAKEKLFAVSVEPVASTPAQLDATVKAEIARLGKVIKDADIRLD